MMMRNMLSTNMTSLMCTMLMKFTNDSDSIKNFLQSQVLVMQVAQDSEQGTIQALKDDPDLKHMFDDIKANGRVLVAILRDAGQEVPAELAELTSRAGGKGGGKGGRGRGRGHRRSVSSQNAGGGSGSEAWQEEDCRDGA